MNSLRHVVSAGLLGLASLLSLPGLQATEAVPPPQALNLETALAYALEHSPTLLRVLEQVREQEGLSISVRARRLPQLSLSGTLANTERELLSVAGGVRDSWQLEASLTQVLYAGGSLRGSSIAQRHLTEAARLAVAAQAAETTLAVREAFDRVLLNRELIGVQEAEVTVLEKELHEAKLRREVGSGSDFDVLRTEVALANAKPGLIQARNAWSISIHALLRLMGAPISEASQSLPSLVGELKPESTVPALPALLSHAVTHRPEMLRQQELQVAAERGVDVARAAYLPTLTAFANYDVLSHPLGAAWNSRLEGATVGVKASINLFDGRAAKGAVKQARSQLRQLELAAEELRLAVAYEVRAAHSSLVEAEEVLVSAELTVQQAQESLRLATARKSAGTSTQLDLLSTQTALTQARSRLSNARFAHRVASARLAKAAGLEFSPSKP